MTRFTRAGLMLAGIGAALAADLPARAQAPGQAGGRGGQRGGFVLGAEPMPGGAAEHLGKLKLPAGFSIALYADNVPGARSMALGSDGTVSSAHERKPCMRSWIATRTSKPTRCSPSRAA